MTGDNDGTDAPLLDTYCGRVGVCPRCANGDVGFDSDELDKENAEFPATLKGEKERA